MFLLLHSWLSNVAPYTCCYALDFQTQFPTTFLLLGSWLSNITCRYVRAATLLTFEHSSIYRSILCLLLLRSWLSNIIPTYSYYVCCCYALDFLTTFLLLRSWLSNITSDYVPAATLLAFQHCILLRSCF